MSTSTPPIHPPATSSESEMEDEDESEEEDEEEDSGEGSEEGDELESDASSTTTIFEVARIQPRHTEGKWKLIVPPEVINMPVDIASRDKELCYRLEETIIQWNKLIKEVLSNQSMTDAEDFSGPLHEIEFWRNKYLDLTDLMKQIRSQPVRLVRDIMQIIKSPYIAAFIKVSEEILNGSKEAISNHHYLQALRPHCNLIDKTSIKELPNILKEILWVFRVIWLNAPFYNTRDKLNGLLRKFSNVFIIKCVHAIKVHKVFDGHIQSSEETLKDCLNLLIAWRTKYFEAQKMHSMNSFTAWLLEYDKIFAHVDAFVQRIRDLLEICTCQRLYARRVEGNQHDLPLYPGTKASDLTKVMLEVERMFDRQLRILTGYSRIALNVRQAEWHQQMSLFKLAIKDMEMMIQNVLMSSFDAVSNIEQGILLLESFYGFYQRESIIRTYDKLTVKLYKLFEQEIMQVKRLHAKNILPLPLTYPEMAGRGAWALFMKRRLDLNYECLTNAWWIPDCGYGEDVIAQYKVLASILEDSRNQFYREWIKQVGNKDLTPRLAIPLMIRSTYKPGMIEVNFDKFLYRHIAEAEMWARLGREIPPVLQNVLKDRERLHNLRETVLLVVKDYNRIVASLSPEERSLFKERIKLLDRKVYPGLTRLTWSSDVSGSYIADCRQTANKVQGFTNDYKNANIKIGKLAIKMTSYSMVKLDPKRIFDDSDAFNEFQRKFREKAILKVATKYKDITLILRAGFEMFRGDGPEVKAQWLKYLNTIDEVIQEALCINFRRSLEILKQAILGDVRGPPAPIFRLIIVLSEDRLDFDPTTLKVREMILGIFGKICHTIRPFPRVIQFLNDPTTQIASFSEVLASDEPALVTQAQIKEGVTNCVTQVEKHLAYWEPYADIWELDKDEFMTEYEENNPSVASFDADINRYTQISNTVQGQEAAFSILFVQLDCSFIQDIISHECKKWQERLLQVLFEIASAKLSTYYNYMSTTMKKFDRIPKKAEEKAAMLRVLRFFFSDIPIKEVEFPLMMEQFECLKKYDFEFGDYIKNQLSEFNANWKTYVQKLKDVDSALKQTNTKDKKEKK